MRIERIAGDNVRGFRNKKKWSQEQLAAKASLFYTYIGKVERAEATISITNLAKIAKQLKVPVHIFLIENAYQLSDERLKELSP